MITGRTYTLTDASGNAARYYRAVSDLTDGLLELVPDQAVLLGKVRRESSRKTLFRLPGRRGFKAAGILQALEEALSPFITGVEDHLGSLSVADRFDRTLRTSRKQYLLHMLEIELTNRLNRERFSRAPWRMALIAHCLRDFRKDCRSLPGEVEETCGGCHRHCHVNTGSRLLERHRIHAFISVSMDHRDLFRRLVRKHPGMGVLGIACVPELVEGLRLCDRLGIPAVGVPLDANRCSRWLGECLETTFSLEELERLVEPVSGS